VEGVNPNDGYGTADSLIGFRASDEKGKPIIAYQSAQADTEKQDADKIEFTQTG